MNGLVSSRPARFAQRAAILLAAALLGLTMALATPTASHATENAVPISFSFTDLLPGEPASQLVKLEIPRDGTLDDFAWVDRTGILANALFEFEICATQTACTPLSHIAHPMAVKAGTLALLVTVTIAEQGSGTAVGKLTLSSDGAGDANDPFADITGSENGALATTGVNAISIALWGSAALTLGTVALLWRRTRVSVVPHRQHEETSRR